MVQEGIIDAHTVRHENDYVISLLEEHYQAGRSEAMEDYQLPRNYDRT